MHVSGLFVYFIKSCAGKSLNQVVVGDRGLQHDRHWMLVDSNGKMITQRTAGMAKNGARFPELEPGLPDLR